MKRVHTELLVGIWDDLQGESVGGKFDREQDQDNLLYVASPQDWYLAAGEVAADNQVPFQGSYLRFIALAYLTTATGVNLHFGSSSATALLVKPPIGTGLEGQFMLTTSASSLYLSNPSSSDSVTFRMIMGFANIA